MHTRRDKAEGVMEGGGGAGAGFGTQFLTRTQPSDCQAHPKHGNRPPGQSIKGIPPAPRRLLLAASTLHQSSSPHSPSRDVPRPPRPHASVDLPGDAAVPPPPVVPVTVAVGPAMTVGPETVVPVAVVPVAVGPTAPSPVQAQRVCDAPALLQLRHDVDPLAVPLPAPGPPLPAQAVELHDVGVAPEQGEDGGFVLEPGARERGRRRKPR